MVGIVGGIVYGHRLAAGQRYVIADGRRGKNHRLSEVTLKALLHDL